jgi:hypothetical protein
MYTPWITLKPQKCSLSHHGRWYHQGNQQNIKCNNRTQVHYCNIVVQGHCNNVIQVDCCNSVMVDMTGKETKIYGSTSSSSLMINYKTT